MTLDAAHRHARLMMDDPDMDTPLLRRIGAHIDIDDDCREYIRTLQSEPMVFGPGADIIQADAEASRIYVVQYGWLYGYSFTSSGQRFVHRIYQPGDFVAIEDINWNYRSSNVSSVTACVVTAFDKPTLRRIFEESPRLARTIFSIVAMTQVQTYDLARSVSRLPAEARLADFLLQLHARGRVAGTLHHEDEFHLPLTQSQIGDAIGLTNVSVSRAFTALERAGLLKRSGRMIRFRERDKLVEMADFIDRHDAVDRDWIEADPPERRAFA